ncbi:MAG: dephospho-CoA kinase, partial [Bacilli bacterium]|nr:dephospho-CoA kinase [Bacilli bacterium]
MIIGVTGKSGSGKTYFSDLLNKNDDFTVIHVDEIVHQILDNPYFIMTFIGKYGKQFMAKDYTINREELGRFLFEYANRIRVTEYNEFIYPWIEKEIDKIIFSTKKPVIIDWMHLPETKYFSKCEY